MTCLWLTDNIWKKINQFITLFGEIVVRQIYIEDYRVSVTRPRAHHYNISI